MKFLKKAAFESKLYRRFPEDRDGWFYNVLREAYGCKCSYTISARAKLESLIAKTCRIIMALNSSYPIYAFPDLAAGWRAFPKNRRWSPVELADPAELANLLREHIYFRHPQNRIDNYHIADSNFRWIAVFCHHDDWHFFASPQLVALAKKA